jgi:hypothetical protein
MPKKLRLDNPDLKRGTGYPRGICIFRRRYALRRKKDSQRDTSKLAIPIHNVVIPVSPELNPDHTM